MALRLAGVQPGDEVLIPALTFVATATAVAYCGATPHFVDSEERTLRLNPKALREYLQGITEIRSGQCVNPATGRVIGVLIPMHTFGHPVDIEGVLTRETGKSFDDLWETLAKPSRFDPADVMFVKCMLQYALPESWRSLFSDILFKKYVSVDAHAFAR